MLAFYDIGSPGSERDLPAHDGEVEGDRIEDVFDWNEKTLNEVLNKKTSTFLLRYDSIIAMTLVLGFDETKIEGLPELVHDAQRLLLEADTFWEVRFAHVKGHARVEGNVGADAYVKWEK